MSTWGTWACRHTSSFSEFQILNEETFPSTSSPKDTSLQPLYKGLWKRILTSRILIFSYSFFSKHLQKKSIAYSFNLLANRYCFTPILHWFANHTISESCTWIHIILSLISSYSSKNSKIYCHWRSIGSLYRICKNLYWRYDYLP